jgi:hypothetical protein
MSRRALSIFAATAGNPEGRGAGARSAPGPLAASTSCDVGLEHPWDGLSDLWLRGNQSAIRKRQRHPALLRGDGGRTAIERIAIRNPLGDHHEHPSA